MKLKQLNEAIAAACNVRPQVVSAIQAETFRQIRAALDKGEKVIVPDWGIFTTRDVPAGEGEPARKLTRFRERAGDGGKAGKNKNKPEGQSKKPKKKSAGEE